MRKTRDYYGLWEVEFTTRFSTSVFSRRRVSAWTLEEAVKKAMKIERKETVGVCSQITSVRRTAIIDG